MTTATEDDLGDDNFIMGLITYGLKDYTEAFEKFPERKPE